MVCYLDHDEGGGEYILEDDNPEPIGVKFYGMSSETANEKHFGGLKEVLTPQKEKKSLFPTEEELIILYKLFLGVRLSCTYVGARRIKDLTKCTTFVKVYNTHNTIFGDL